MKIVKLNVLPGPNVFSYKPALWLKIDLEELADTPSSAIEGFTDRLLSILPGLKDHHCSVGHAGGFAERLVEGTYLAHIFEHVTLELQNICGDNVGYGKARQAAGSVYDVVVAYRHEAVGKRCCYLAEQILNALAANKSVAVMDKIQEIRGLWEELQLGPSAAAVHAAAQRRGLPVQRLGGEDLLTIGQGKFSRRVWSTVTQQTSLLNADLVGNKYLTIKLLEQNGIPVSVNEIARNEDEAVAIFKMLGAPIVVKPLGGSHGRGVTIDITGETEVRQAFRFAAGYDEAVLLERYIPGRQYRLCMVDYKLIAAAERIPAYVIGDGKHTIDELVEQVNSSPLRGEGHNAPLTRIVIDDISLAVLAKQGLAPQMVPEARRVVKIKETANISTGGTAVDVTPLVHPDNVLLAERIARLVGLDIAGLDIIAADIGRPLTADNGAVIEVNAAPGIRMHQYPSAGMARDVGAAIVDYLFPIGSNGRIPVAAVTGTNGKTTTTRLLGRILREVGFTVGMTTTEGVYVDDKCVLSGDCSGPGSARLVLANGDVDAAVLETARGGMIRSGLGFERCDVGIVTNISEDHLGQDGVDSLEDLANIKSLVLEVVAPGGAAVINADDRFASLLARKVQAAIVYFSCRCDNRLVRRHLGVGGKAVFVKNGRLCLAEGSKMQDLGDIVSIPLTMNGLAAHNVENVLAAVAGAYGMNIGVQHIRAAVQDFTVNTGRLNMIDMGDFQVCVDYGHNLAGYRAIIETARKMRPSRLVGVIAAPGDRRDDIIVTLGETAGRGFDKLYIKEDADLRGRRAGETARLLARGAAIGDPDIDMTTIPDEAAAVAAALAAARPGDLVVVFYENYAAVMRTVQNHAQAPRIDETPEQRQAVQPHIGVPDDELSDLVKNLRY